MPDSDLALACVLARPDGGAAWRRKARETVAAGGADGDDRLREVIHSDAAAEVTAALGRRGWRWVPEADLPAGVTAISDPPLGLFVRGTLDDAVGVAVVGARRASAYGREVAEHLGREVAGGGATVISGMARGVDAAAHRGALAVGGKTVAVWGSGPDVVYPGEHASLAEEIASCGALVTEYPPGTPPLARHFPERNRLIAGLARVVVVVEADERSGALVTARLALDEGREVMAVPGSIFSRLSAGPNGLLRAGAAPVVSAADVLEAVGLSARQDRQAGDPPAFLDLVPAGKPISVDRVAAASGRPVAEVLDELLRLELNGWLSREADGRYRRSRLKR